MSREHGLTLIDSELSEIVRIAEKLSADAARIDWMQAQEVKRGTFQACKIRLIVKVSFLRGNVVPLQPSGEH